MEITHSLPPGIQNLEFASYINFETVHKKAKHCTSASLTPLQLHIKPFQA